VPAVRPPPQPAVVLGGEGASGGWVGGGEAVGDGVVGAAVVGTAVVGSTDACGAGALARLAAWISEIGAGFDVGTTSARRSVQPAAARRSSAAALRCRNCTVLASPPCGDVRALGIGEPPTATREHREAAGVPGGPMSTHHRIRGGFERTTDLNPAPCSGSLKRPGEKRLRKGGAPMSCRRMTAIQWGSGGYTKEPR
jgi:hypothetical protein